MARQIETNCHHWGESNSFKDEPDSKKHFVLIAISTLPNSSKFGIFNAIKLMTNYVRYHYDEIR